MPNSTAAGFSGVEVLESRVLLAAISWDGGGDGTHFEDPLNWAGDVVPSALDDVTINIAGDPVITTGQTSISLHSIVCFEAVDITLAGFSLTLAAASQFKGPVFIKAFGGQLGGDGIVTFQGVTHIFNWEMAPTGRTVFGPAAAANIAGVKIERRVDNLGALTLGNKVQIKSDGRLNNMPGGALTLLGGGLSGDATALLNNLGLITVAPGGYSLLGDVGFKSTGTISLAVGSLKLANASGPTLIDGEVFIGSQEDLRIDFDVAAVFGPDAHVFGNGSLTINNASLVSSGVIDKLGSLVTSPGGNAITEFNGPTSVGTLDMEAGTLGGSADVLVLNTLKWHGGDMVGSGRTVVTANAEGDLNGANLTLTRTFVNNHHAVLARSMTLDGGTFVNNPGADFEISTPANGTDTVLKREGAASVFNNKGTLTLDARPNSRVIFDNAQGGVRLTNTGTLVASGGGAKILGPITQVTGTTLTGGTWVLQCPVVMAANIRTNAASVTLEGSGAALSALAGLTTNQGSLTVRLESALVIVPLGGTFTNFGTLTVGLGAELDVIGGFTQTAQGTTDIRIAGTTEDQFGRIVATGAATLAGKATFEFVNGFVPAAGEKFLFLSSASRTGTFGSLSSVGLPQGLKLSLVHFAKGVRMDILNA